MEEQRHSKEDFYLAQIAAEVRRGWVTKPKTVSVNDFLITMKATQQQERLKQSKNAWASFVGVKLEEN